MPESITPNEFYTSLTDEAEQTQASSADDSYEQDRPNVHVAETDPETKKDFVEFVDRYGEDGLKFLKIAELAGTKTLQNFLRLHQSIHSTHEIVDLVANLHDLTTESIEKMQQKLETTFSSNDQQKMAENIFRIAANLLSVIVEFADDPSKKKAAAMAMGGEIKLFSADDTSLWPEMSDEQFKKLPPIMQDNRYTSLLLELRFLQGTVSDLGNSDQRIALEAINSLLFTEVLPSNEFQTVDVEAALNDQSTLVALEEAGFRVDQLRRGVTTETFEAQKFLFLKGHEPNYLAPQEISSRLKNLYDSPLDKFDLRKYENKTVNTPKSLGLLWGTMEDYFDFVNLTRQDSGQPGSFKFRTSLDICGGEGRSGIPLTYLGKDHRVNAYDISPVMVERSANRVNEDLQTHYLYDQASAAGLPLAPIEEHGEYKQVVGDFHSFGPEQYQQAFPESDRPELITIMWHSFCFAGNREGQFQVLRNAFEILKDNGLLVIEVPDPSFGAYHRELTKFHQNNPSTAFGTLIDAPSDGAGNASNQQDSDNLTPRFFPSISAIEELMERAGFSIWETESHIIKHQAEDGTEIPVIRELVISAYKPGPRAMPN